MPTKTKIEWCDYVSNPIKARADDKTGWACVKLSEGCANCWASGFNVRLGTGLEYTLPNMKNVEVFLDEVELERLKTFQPKGPFKNGRARPLVFPCDMTDMFGAWVRVEWIKRIFEAFAARLDVDFMVLTKRPDLMESFVAGAAPLGNVILGVSIENQERAVSRWEAMWRLHRRGWKTGISYEPALGLVNWEPWDFVDWMICGGESGPKARPMAPVWARHARDFAVMYDIPFFFKQWGEWGPCEDLVEQGMKTFKRQPEKVSGSFMARVGKGLAGHELDGEMWRQAPGAAEVSHE